MSESIECPAIVTNDMLEYLDKLRTSGVTNMFGARPYIAGAFGLSSAEASAVLTYWMRTFSERHPNEKEE